MPAVHDDEPPEDATATISRLFDELGPGLLRYVGQRVGQSAAEDIISDTFLAVMEQLDRFDASRGTERAWVYGIATNLLRHYLREQSRRSAPRARYQDDEVGLDIVADRVSDQVDAHRHVRQLAAALDQVSDEDRDVLLLTAWNGLTSSEIAQVLDIPAGTVRSRLHRVRQHLRAASPQLESDPPATAEDAKK